MLTLFTQAEPAERRAVASTAKQLMAKIQAIISHVLEVSINFVFLLFEW